MLFGYTQIAVVEPSEILSVLRQYQGCEAMMETTGTDDGDIAIWMHNGAINWERAIASCKQDGIPAYEVLPQYQNSPLATATEITKTPRKRRTNAEIEAAKAAEPVLPKLPEQEQSPVEPSPSPFATTTKRRFGKPPVEATEAEVAEVHEAGEEVA